jgi:hypothetical protein
MQLEDLEEILAYLVEVAEDTTSQVAKLQELADKELMARFDMVTRLSRLERKVDRLDEDLDWLLDAAERLIVDDGRDNLDPHAAERLIVAHSNYLHTPFS